MSEHERVREWLALSAAGMLECGEERRVRDHAAQCVACRAELDEYADLSAGLRTLPAPQPPSHLVAQTAALVALEADRRQGSYFAAGSAILVFILIVAGGETLRMLMGDAAALAWLLWATLSSLCGAAAALVLRGRRRFQRSII